MASIALPKGDKSPFAKRGLTRLVDFRLGLNDKQSPLLIDDKEVADIQNFEFDQNGTLEKRKGYTKRFAADFATGPVRGLYNYRKEDGTTRLVFAADDKVFSDRPNFSQLYDLQADWETTGVVRDGITTSEVSGDIKPVIGTLSTPGNIVAGGRGGIAGGTHYHRQKTWTGNALDISGVSDKTTGRIIKSVTNPSGTTTTVETRVSNDGVSWDAWTALGGGDTIQAVGTKTKIEVRARFNSTSGLRGSAQSFQVLFDQTTTATSIASGLSTSARYDFETMNDTLWVVNGENTNKKWDATTWADMGGTPPQGKFIINHKNRLFVAGTTANRSRLYYSDILTPETWNALSFIDVGKGDGDTITGMGILLDMLVITKDNSVFILSGDSSSNFVLRRATNEGGSVTKHAFALLRDTLGWLGKDGVRFFDGVKSALASEKIETTMNALNSRQLAQAAGVLWKNHYYIAVPEGASLTNNLVLVYDLLRTAWTKYRGVPAGEWVIFRQFNQDTLVFGSSTKGQLYNWETAGYTDDGAAITAYVVTKALAPAGGIEAPSLIPDVFIAAQEPSSLATSVVASFFKDLGSETAGITLSMAAMALNVLRVIPSTVGVSLARSIATKVTHSESGKGCRITAIDVRYSPKTIRST